MSEVKHTPGPWHAAHRYIYAAPRLGPVGLVYDTSERADGGEGVANALLMAAAPDLLEACELALRSLEVGSTLGAPILRRAIAKAEGREVPAHA